MQRTKLYHPVVFDQSYAESYYKRNYKVINKVADQYTSLLQKSGFTGGMVLDSGCGFGAIAIKIAQTFPDAKITGIDLSEPLLEMARKDAEKAGVAEQITFQKGDATQIDLTDNAFDLVINTFLVHLVEDPVAMLKEIERVTKADGKIMLTDLRRNWLALFTKKLKKAFTQDEAMQIIRASNLRPGTPFKGPYWWSYMVGIKTD